ncbi:curli production assembly/transport protein CsgE [Pseudomonas putida]|uniref:Curli production assembly/transport component CsgE n=1 Tax=Pseudomonas putida (strain W619) TaxID=390235 RepID=B1J8A4_PSEPW|nr:curli production assembly/transport protein CsgE [Pseudomonas putida]QQE86454.1 curli production assembly/transport protein CsgE [Pseudomonas putida]
MKRLNVFCLSLGLLLAAGVSDVARADAEDEMKGFIVDNTISHIGHDFYAYFADRLRATSRLDFNLVVRERPDARWGSLITVEFERDVLYRRFLPPNVTQLKEEAVAAADLVKQEVIQRKLQRLLQDTTDLERDEL